MIKKDDKFIAAVRARSSGSELLVSTMTGSGPAYETMFELLKHLAANTDEDLPEGQSIGFQGRVAVVLSPSGDEARRFLVRSANAILDTPVADEVPVTLVEWGSDLVSHGVVDADEVPRIDEVSVSL